MTRPLAAVTGAMRDVAATGDLTRKVPLRSRAWDDEDARLLAAAFNTLTESIARFQREAAQRERLSSLGRLSTVIAHEIRNPLMIIKASLRTLRRDERAPPDDVREAVADIDEETTRLNRMVTDVLDFAKPIRFELRRGRRQRHLPRVGGRGVGRRRDAGRCTLDLDPSLPPRSSPTPSGCARRSSTSSPTPATPSTAGASGPAGARRRVATSRRHGSHARDATAVSPSPSRIAASASRADDLAHIFDPYFTTRRAGTGLGLPIAKNIIEGLGGTHRRRQPARRRHRDPHRPAAAPRRSTRA